MSVTVFLSASSPAATASEQWTYTRGDDGPKFGYSVPGNPNNFEFVYAICDPTTKVITFTVSVGPKRPAAGTASATFVSAAGKVALTGAVEAEDFEGIYYLSAAVPREHAVFQIIAGGPVQFSNPAGTFTLMATGAKQVVSRFLAACRGR